MRPSGVLETEQPPLATVTYSGYCRTKSYTGFTFSWTSAVVAGFPKTTPSLTALVADTYTLTTTHTSSKCVSAPVSITVGNTLTLQLLPPPLLVLPIVRGEQLMALLPLTS